jgi:hypothetical protein
MLLRTPDGRTIELSESDIQRLLKSAPQDRSSVAQKPSTTDQIVQAGTGIGSAVAAKGVADAIFGGGAAATSAATPATPVILSASKVPLGASGAINPALGTAATAAGAFGLYDLFKNDRDGVRGPLQGAASGAAMGSFGGPVGMGIGAAVGGLLGLGQSIFGGKSKTKVEEDRRKALAEQGINLGDTKGWELNEAFKNSRQESDLTGKDITQAATLYSIFGDKWKNASEENRIKVADEALKRGIVREHHGTIDLTDKPQDFMDFAGTTLAQVAPQAGGPRKPSGPRKPLEPEFKPNPNLPIEAITPTYKAPAPQAEPDNGDYVSLFNEFLKRRSYAG